MSDAIQPWEDRRQAWVEAEKNHPYDDRPARAAIRAARRDARKGGPLDTPEAWAWVEDALQDRDKRWFVAEVFNYSAAPRRLGPPFLKAGVHELDPSNNRYLVEPAVAILGARKVLERLTQYMQTGSNVEKAGAASARYWVGTEREKPGQAEATQAFNDAQLAEFVTNSDLDVRRRILPGLRLDPGVYSPELAARIPQAIAIARAHPDEYIRHRIEIQLGSGGPFMVLPAAAATPSLPPISARESAAVTPGGERRVSIYVVALVTLALIVAVVAWLART